MRLLLIGDIVGRPGKHVCSQVIPQLIRDRNLDFVVANAENAAAGSGLTVPMFNKLRHYGVDVCTMGDHVYKRRETLQLLETADRVVRPANLPREAIGNDLAIFRSRNGPSVAVFVVLGRTFMNVRSDCPFHAADRILGSIPPDVRTIILDIHAETTSEKIAMGWYLDGRVSAVVGTHTHVQTADECILPRGTAYITDLGMTGPHDSVLGRDKEAVVKSLVTGVPRPYTVASGDARASGLIVEVDDRTGRAQSAERISIADPSPPGDGHSRVSSPASV